MTATRVAQLHQKTIDEVLLLYPGLWRRQATPKERARLIDASVVSPCATRVTIMRATEIDMLIEGHRELFKTQSDLIADDADPAALLSFTPYLPTSEEVDTLPLRPGASQEHPQQHNPYTPLFECVGVGPWADILASAATMPELLVPIRIDVEHEGRFIRDTFTWNIHGEYKRGGERLRGMHA